MNCPVRYFVAKRNVTNVTFVTCAGINLSIQEKSQILGPASREVKIRTNSIVEMGLYNRIAGVDGG